MNNFLVTVLEDGTIRCESPGGFTPETHKDADKFIAELEALSGVPAKTKSLKQSLGNPHAQQHGQQQGNHQH